MPLDNLQEKAKNLFKKRVRCEALRPSLQDEVGTLGLPGKEISLKLCPPDFACEAGFAGHLPASGHKDCNILESTF
jgi:hypothetical protein